MNQSKKIIIPIAVLIFGYGATSVFAQTSQGTQSLLYVPLVGISLVPEPFTLPEGGGKVTYHYAVKNFLPEVPMTNIRVTDDACGPVVFIEGDDNGNAKLEYSETWRYTCVTRLSQTTESTALVTGGAGDIIATHNAYATVVVGGKVPAPLVSIINISKIAYPLSLPIEGGPVTFTYKVSNPGNVPLRDVVVIDDKCNAMSGKIGDTNGNKLLDVNEVWIYTCTATLKETTTNTVRVTAYANGLKAVGDATLVVKVDTLTDHKTTGTPGFSEGGAVSDISPDASADIKIPVWGTMAGVLASMIIFFVATRKNLKKKKQSK